MDVDEIKTWKISKIMGWMYALSEIYSTEKQEKPTAKEGKRIRIGKDNKVIIEGH